MTKKVYASHASRAHYWRDEYTPPLSPNQRRPEEERFSKSTELTGRPKTWQERYGVTSYQELRERQC